MDSSGRSPQRKNNLETTIVVIVERDGKVQKSWFEKRSGNAHYDQMQCGRSRRPNLYPLSLKNSVTKPLRSESVFIRNKRPIGAFFHSFRVRGDKKRETEEASRSHVIPWRMIPVKKSSCEPMA